MDKSTPPIIHAVGLSKSFDGGTSFALEEVSVSIMAGEFVAVIGLSGAGKSTFLRSLIGTHLPTRGTLEVLGINVGRATFLELKELRKQTGFIFQQFNLIKNLTALQNVLIGRIAYAKAWRRWLGFFSGIDKRKAVQTLDSVGLKNRCTDKVRVLSGGQQQRVAIARALVQDPKIILADEPMASLDPNLSEVVLDILAGTNRTRKTTVIVNIHVLDLARKYAGRIIGFRRGRVVFDGPPTSLTQDILDAIYRLEPENTDLQRDIQHAAFN